MYDTTDPRSTLPASRAALPAKATNGWDEHTCVHFLDGPPQEADDHSRRWYARGQNFLVACVDARAGARIERADQPDEYVVLLPGHDAGLRIATDHGTVDVPGHSVAIVPAGGSRIEVLSDCRLFLLFTTRSADLCEKAVNRQAYATPHAHVAPLEPWPDPVDGPRPRVYSMAVADEPGRFGRIWRCSTFMVNLFVEHGPRDVEKVSPHHHDDFEQGSLMLTGTMTHHLRWPWTTNMRHWLPDRHLDCHGPSLTVIPPPAIHTSNATGPGPHLMFDVFCPPRLDFSQKPGWVLNADTYPMPVVSRSGMGN